MTPLVREMAMIEPEVALDFVWFDVGQLQEIAGDGPDAAIHKIPLPFDKCAIVGIDHSGKRFVLFTTITQGLIAVFGFVLGETSYQQIQTFVYEVTGNGIRVMPYVKNEPVPERSKILVSLAIIGTFLNRANPVGYKAQQKQSFTARRKASAGKKLSFDWTTVVIEPPSMKSSPLGGRHASPRQHDRRGHFRRLKSGRQVWVRNCKVGNAANGVVFHDYAAAIGTKRKETP